jgi:hypothetical protein
VPQQSHKPKGKQVTKKEMIWQSINTAPSGEIVIVYVKPYVELAINNCVTGWVVVNAPLEYAGITPTHWMPLPKAPNQED